MMVGTVLVVTVVVVVVGSRLIMPFAINAVNQDIIGTAKLALAIMIFCLWEKANLGNEQIVEELLVTHSFNHNIPGHMNMQCTQKAIFNF